MPGSFPGGMLERYGKAKKHARQWEKADKLEVSLHHSAAKAVL